MPYPFLSLLPKTALPSSSAETPSRTSTAQLSRSAQYVRFQTFSISCDTSHYYNEARNTAPVNLPSSAGCSAVPLLSARSRATAAAARVSFSPQRPVSARCRVHIRRVFSVKRHNLSVSGYVENLRPKRCGRPLWQDSTSISQGAGHGEVPLRHGIPSAHTGYKTEKTHSTTSEADSTAHMLGARKNRMLCLSPFSTFA